MPPKKKKQATAKSKAASTKKKKDVKDAPKSGVALSSKSWTLSGGLAALPLELLQHVFSFLVLDTAPALEGCKSVLRFLSTTKALYTWSLESETLFYDMYCWLQRSQRWYMLGIIHIQHHPIFSPKYSKDAKNAQPVKYDIKAPLPRDAIFDWREQFISTLIFAEAKHCTHCRVSRQTTILVKLDHWNSRLCLRCCARYLVRRSDITKYNVTPNDVGRLVPNTYRIPDGKNKPAKAVDYYCGTQLIALAAQKHGEHKAAKNAPKAKSDARQARSDLLSTFALLQCGSGGSWFFWHDMRTAGPPNVDPGWFHVEFDRAVTRAGYRKNAPNYQATLDGKGTPYPTKLRELPEVIADWGRMIHPHLHLFIRKAKDETEEPFFRPAPAPGPFVPTEASIAAYSTLRKAFAAEKLYMSDKPSMEELRKYQEYILAPTDAGLASALAAAKDRKKPVQPSGAQPIASVTNDAESSAAAAEKGDQHRTNEDELMQQRFQELDQEAKRHEWPTYQPNAAQIASEQAIVKVLAQHENISEQEARKARLERINSVIRAAAVAKLDARKNFLTKFGDLEKMKWSLIYDEYKADSELFGHEYVNATRWKRDSAKKKMLLEVYKGTASARAARVDAAIKKQEKQGDPWYADDIYTYTLSGPYLGYTACPARRLEDRTRFAFKDVVESILELVEDCRANLITPSSLDGMLQELGQVAVYKCPYRPNRPFCAHNSNWQCWFRHTHPNGTEWLDRMNAFQYARSGYSVSSDDQMMMQMEEDGQLDFDF